MKKTQRIIGQILLAVGTTLAIGGVVSFVFEKTELRFFDTLVTSETGRIIWIVANVLLAFAGFYLLRISKTKDSAS